jgi:hypothetical protein
VSCDAATDHRDLVRGQHRTLRLALRTAPVTGPANGPVTAGEVRRRRRDRDRRLTQHRHLHAGTRCRRATLAPAFDTARDATRGGAHTRSAREGRLCRRSRPPGRHRNADGLEIRANEGGREQRPDARDNRESRSLRCRLSGLPRRHSGRCFIGSPSHSPTSSEPPPGSHCEGRSGGADATRRRCCPRQGTVAASPRPLCRVSSRGGSPSGASHQTNAAALPERSQPVVGLPTPGTGSTGRSRPSTASSALRRTRGCAGVHRVQILRGSPILARVFRRPAPRRRTGAASCRQLLHGR